MKRPLQTVLWVLPLMVVAGAAVVFALRVATSATRATGTAESPRPFAGFGSLPRSFEANHGQTNSLVRFMSRGRESNWFLTDNEAVWTFHELPREEPTVVRMRYGAGSRSADLEGIEPLEGRVNYFVGDDPQLWRTGIPSYRRVVAKQVYPGVDVAYYGTGDRLEFDFIVAAGADPSTIRFTLVDRQGESLPFEIGRDGSLLVDGPNGSVRFHTPKIYQNSETGRTAVDGGYRVMTAPSGARDVGFVAAAYDHSQPLVIDPVVSYSTYLGGSGNEQGNRIAVDSSGSAYVVGQTPSADFPVQGDLQLPGGGTDAFISKFNAAGTGLVYSTYLGGSGDDTAFGVSVDSLHNAYIVGRTTGNFPTVAAFQSSPGGMTDGFVTKLTPDGAAIVYSTYLGGSDTDMSDSLATDAQGNAYVAGQTLSTDFPTVNALQTTFGGAAGASDAFVAKFAATGGVVYSTYLGGSSNDSGNGIGVDANGNAFVGGLTFSSDFPVTPNVFQSTYGGDADAFISVITADGSALLSSTYFGSADFEGAVDLAVDAAGNVAITGNVFGYRLPVTSNAAQSTFGGGGTDAFVAKFNGSLTTLMYSSFLGGSGGENGRAITADAAGNLYVNGVTSSTNFPLRRPVQTTLSGMSDMFITKVNPSGGPFVYSTYWGGSGSGSETGNGIAVDAAGSAYAVATTSSTDFPTVNPFQATTGGGSDAGIVKLSSTADLRIVMSDSPDPVALGSTITYVITVSDLGPDAASNVRVTDTLPIGTTLVSVSPSQGTCSGTVTVVCSLGVLDSGAATILLRVTVNSSEGTVSNTATVSALEPDPVTTNNSATALTRTTGGFVLKVKVNTTFGNVSSNPAGINCLTDCSQTYIAGTGVRLAARPAVGWQLNYWLGACTGSNLTCIVTMTSNQAVEAVFSLIQ